MLRLVYLEIGKTLVLKNGDDRAFESIKMFKKIADENNIPVGDILMEECFFRIMAFLN